MNNTAVTEALATILRRVRNGDIAARDQFFEAVGVACTALYGEAYTIRQRYALVAAVNEAL